MALTTLEAVKTHLNITASDEDDELQTFIEAVTKPIENVVGPIETRTVTEVHYGGNYSLVLLQAPVLSLTSIEPVHDGLTAVAVSDVDVSLNTGVVRRLDGYKFDHMYRVTYEAGRGDTPANVELAARIVVDHLWRTQRGQLTELAGGELQFEPTGFLIPRRAMELLIPNGRTPMVA